MLLLLNNTVVAVVVVVVAVVDVIVDVVVIVVVFVVVVVVMVEFNAAFLHQTWPFPRFFPIIILGGFLLLSDCASEDLHQ